MDENTPPSGYKHLTNTQIMQCLTLNRCGWTQRAIAAEVGCSKSTVGRVLKDYDYETFVQRKQHPGPARKTSETDDQLLIQIAKKHYNLLFCDITNIAGLPISPKTVAR